MALRALLSTVLLACTLAGCGGGNESAPNLAASEPTRLLASVQTAAPIVFSGVRANYTITATASGFAVADIVGTGGTLAVPKTARLRFADMSVALDTDRNSGQVYRLYQAAFNRVPDVAGLGYWINAMDNGAALGEIAAGFVGSNEFKAVYGTSGNNNAIVAAYYLNALHRTGDAAGIAYWLNLLDKQQVNQPNMLVMFSESAENQVAVASVIQNGIAYIEPGIAYMPQARAGASLNAITGTTVTLDGSSSTSPAGNPLSYRWTLVSKPAGSTATLLQATTARPNFVADKAGTYLAELVVNDGRDSAPARVSVSTVWQAPASAIPATGNYVYLQSDSGDYVGGGRNYIYTSKVAALNVTANAGLISVSVAGDEDWSANFMAMNTLTRLQPGYYSDLMRYPFHNPTKGGLDWSGEGRGCNELTGSFYIDKITYSGDTLTAVDLRFEQHCEGKAAALRGQVHWTAGEIATIPGPVRPIPATLWQPAAGATPATGNYIFLSGTAGDYIGGNRTYLYSQATAVLKVTSNGALFKINVTGNEYWRGEFIGMNTLTRLEPGYYSDLSRYPFHNALKGGLSWGGEGRDCNTLTGWFAVDSVSYTGDTLKTIDLRFEQHCEGGGSALRGKIHWDSSDTTKPVGPISG